MSHNPTTNRFQNIGPKPKLNKSVKDIWLDNGKHKTVWSMQKHGWVVTKYNIPLQSDECFDVPHHLAVL